MSTLQRPKIKAGYLVIRRSADEVTLRLGSWSGPLLTLVDERRTGQLATIVSLLDGTRSVAEVIEQVGEQHAAAVASLLQDLAAKGVLEEHDPAPPSPIRSFFSVYTQADRLQHTVGTATVCIVGAGALGARVAANLAALGTGRLVIAASGTLDQSHIELTPVLATAAVGSAAAKAVAALVTRVNPRVTVEAVDVAGDPAVDDLAPLMEPCDLTVVCTDHPAPGLWRRINKASLALRQMWTLATLDGLDGQVGPSFIPSETACFACYEGRLESHMDDQEAHGAYVAQLAERPLWSGGVTMALPGMADVVAGLLATDLPNVLTTRTGFTVGKLLLMHFPTLEFETHPVLKLPRCALCGSPARARPTLAPYASLSNILTDMWTQQSSRDGR